MRLFDRITERTNSFVEYCDKYSGQNICLFGAGSGAFRLFHYLKKRNIEVSRIAVNSDYLEKARDRARTIFVGEGYPDIVSFEDVMTEGIAYDVIISFAGWNPKFFDTYKNVSKVINLDVFSGLPELGSLSTVEYDYYAKHRERLEAIYSRLEDEKSRSCFASYINQRISGKYDYSEGIVDQPQYFDDAIIALGDNEVMVDCGAYDGADTKVFFQKAGENSSALLFEADPQNIQLIKECLKNYSENYQIVNKAVLDKACTLNFKSDGNMDSKISDDGDVQIECVSIDTYTSDKNVTLLKMDIEGAELSALIGAKETIKRCKPRLAICIYHKPEDVFTIPEFILSLNPDYKLFVRRYDHLCIETVLLAV